MSQNKTAASIGRLLWPALAAIPVGFGGACSFWGGGIGSRWITDYEAAERAAEAIDKPLLFVCKSGRWESDKALDIVLDAPSVRAAAGAFVFCPLFRAHEPDRRYMAQFGVERVPALVIVHRDGTYHEMRSPTGPEAVVEFLKQARPPGAAPVRDVYLPRKAPYQWRDSLEKAKALSRQGNIPLFLVYQHALGIAARHMNKLLTDSDVARNVADMVHFRQKVSNPRATDVQTPFGVLRIPAVVILHPNGRYEVLELPMDSMAIARFAASAGSIRRRAPATAGTPSATAAPGG